MGKNRGALLLILLVSSSLFLLHEALPLASPATNKNMNTVLRKGGSSGGGFRAGGSGESTGSRGAGRNNGQYNGPGNGRSLPTPGRTIPVIPMHTSPKSTAAHHGCSCSFIALLFIIALWV